MVDFSSYEKLPVQTYLLRVNDFVCVEKTSYGEYKICFDRDKYFLDGELLEDLSNRISANAGFSIDFDDDLAYAGIVKLHVNPVKFSEDDEYILQLIAKIVKYILSSEED